MTTQSLQAATDAVGSAVEMTADIAQRLAVPQSD
jgi:hypothetical protein